jgi:putative dimethyl sulfoxide reductase chaperone
LIAGPGLIKFRPGLLKVNMPISEFLKQLANREAAYRLLSACCYQPAAEWNEEQLMQNLELVCSQISPQAAAAARNMHEAWIRSDIEELTVEYARLFVGPMALQAPPYGSYYLEHGKQVMGESTQAVLQFYRRSGLRMDADFTEMPDHIAVELEFVSYCLQKAVSADDQAVTLQWVDTAGSFLGQFLGKWYIQFCEKLRENSESPFYQALAELTELVVATPLPENAA